MSGCHNDAGGLFHILGPTSRKLLPLSRAYVCRTVRALVSAERSWCK